MKRECGGCTLCCKLLPVPTLSKPAGQRCKYQRFNGCTIYAHRPMACSGWSCAWLIDKETGDLSRPDRSHYVVDIVPDFVTITADDMPAQQVPVVQVWIDPRHPDAHRDPALRKYLLHCGAHGAAALVRYDTDRAMTIIPPNLNAENKWLEIWTLKRGPQHSMQEIAAAVGGLVTEAGQ